MAMTGLTLITGNNRAEQDIFTNVGRSLTTEEKEKLQAQDSRLVPPFRATDVTLNARRYWDLFYKRNENRFFKDRRWTTREFAELLPSTESGVQRQRQLLEVGCGVGNFIFPLMEEQPLPHSYYFYACDFSPRAIDLVKANPLYDNERIKAFQCDITTDQCFDDHIADNSLDVVTMIFVLSAIHPSKFAKTLQNLWRLLRPGGVVLFRDYGLFDMAQIRFRPGHKIANNLYMRQDGTTSYYFEQQELARLFTDNRFDVVTNQYVHRRTTNVKENIDVERTFLQGKFRKMHL